MPRPIDIPDELRHGPFTTAQAQAVGVSKDALLSRRFKRLHRGAYCTADLPITFAVLVRAAFLVLPADACLSHLSALRWLGVTMGPELPLHFSTNTTTQTRHPNIVLHRRQGLLHPRIHQGLRVLGPDRTFVDSATLLGHVNLVRAGDWLVRLALTTPDALMTFAMSSHLNGVRRARRTAPHVRDRVDSVMETDLRLLLRFARLPEPEVNGVITDALGGFLARGDLVFRNWRVVVEYDGWHHERDARQRQKDHLRRERLEENGWRVIVVTIEDMKRPSAIVARVHAALTLAGYSGPPPVMSDSWRRWFHTS
jgi:very-short-patch-repair endonuclease